MTTRTKALPVLALAVALTSACTTLTPTTPASSLPVFLGYYQNVDMRREYIERYACMDHKPLQCTCDSRSRAAMCNCGCAGPWSPWSP